MPRWVQKWDEKTQTSTFVEVGTSRPAHHSAAVQGDIESFVSPVDGSVISDRNQLREHNKRNNVVNTDEFGPDHWENKQKERDNYRRGQHSPREVQRRKMEIWELMNRAERG